MKMSLVAAAVILGLSIGGVARAEDAAKLATASGCMKCHDVDKKKKGPSFKSMAAEFKGKKDADKAILAKVKTDADHPKAEASDTDLAAISKWILAM